MFTIKASDIKGGPPADGSPAEPSKQTPGTTGGSRRDGLAAVVKLLLILLAIPVLAGAVSVYYEAKVDAEIQSAVTSRFPDASAAQVAEFTTENLIFHSDTYGHIDFDPEVYVFLGMKYASVVCGLVSVLMVGLVFVLSRIGSLSRDWLVKVFPPAVGISAVAIAVLTAVNGLLLVGAIYYGESALIGQVHFVVVGLVGIGALIGSVSIIGSLIRAVRPSPFPVPEPELAEDHPFWQLVRDVAEATGAAVPDVVILGELPTFFVYEGAFTTADYQQSGRLMYLSRELSARLEPGELKAVIAHEFGHFIGRDLSYTRKFHFGYRALSGALEQLASVQDWTLVLGRLPSLSLFQFVLSRFGAVERRFSRERELTADGVAIGTCGAETFVSGLTKVVLWVPILDRALRLATDRLEADAGPEEVQRQFLVAVDEMVAQESPEDRESAALAPQPHPFDTHPTLSERIVNAGLDPQAVIRGVRLVSA